MSTPTPTAAPPTLYARIDGTLMLARSDGTTVEIRLTARQWVQLCFDSGQIAVHLQPDLLPDVMHVLQNTEVQVPIETVEAAPCHRLN